MVLRPWETWGYINAVDELMYQMDEQGIHADYLIAGTGTGGTQAGIECGLRLANASAKMLGISVSHHTQLKKWKLPHCVIPLWNFWEFMSSPSLQTIFQ